MLQSIPILVLYPAEAGKGWAFPREGSRGHTPKEHELATPSTSSERQTPYPMPLFI